MGRRRYDSSSGNKFAFQKELSVVYSYDSKSLADHSETDNGEAVMKRDAFWGASDKISGRELDVNRALRSRCKWHYPTYVSGEKLRRTLR